MESYSFCLFVTGLFHLASCPQGSPMLTHTAEGRSFLGLNKYARVFIYHILLIHTSARGHLGCFHILTIVNNATATNMVCTCDLFETLLGILLGVQPAVGPPDHTISTFKKNKTNHRTVFHSNCTSLPSSQQSPSVRFLHLLSTTGCFGSLIGTILMGVRCSLIAVLICIPLSD